jgi:hypothetical protein
MQVVGATERTPPSDIGWRSTHAFSTHLAPRGSFCRSGGPPLQSPSFHPRHCEAESLSGTAERPAGLFPPGNRRGLRFRRVPSVRLLWSPFLQVVRELTIWSGPPGEGQARTSVRCGPGPSIGAMPARQHDGVNDPGRRAVASFQLLVPVFWFSKLKAALVQPDHQGTHGHVQLGGSLLVVRSLDANQHDNGAQALRRCCHSGANPHQGGSGDHGRSASSAGQGKKLTEAGQPESIVRAMVRKKDMP